MTKTRSYGRGIIRFDNFKPCRRPGQPPDPNSVAQPVFTTDRAAKDEACADVASTNGSSTPKQQTVPVPPVSDGKGPVQLLARYSYQANPGKPGGFEEMTITVGQRVEFLRPHNSNPFWWEVKNEMGEVAYAPGSYLVVLENKVSALPWLENKALEAEKEPQEKERQLNLDGGPFGGAPQKVKAYSSAYTKDSAGQSQSKKEFYCEVCDKQLNGLKPYQAHMVSKGHKEELALLE